MTTRATRTALCVSIAATLALSGCSKLPGLTVEQIPLPAPGGVGDGTTVESIHLSITDRDDRALVYCHAGCDTDRVLDALNLDPRDLFDKPKGLGHVSGLLSHAIYNYPDGRIAGRSADKKFRQSGNTKGRSLYFGQTSTGKPLGPRTGQCHHPSRGPSAFPASAPQLKR